ncbi:MAG: PVC-type heme-binding CxxCH protein [Verrucomicrobiota bacterium]
MQQNLIFLLLLATAALLPADWTQTLRFHGNPDLPGKNKHVVFITGDEEYRSEETGPMLAKILSKRFGFKSTVLFALNPDGNFIDINYQKNIGGMEAIAKADLVIIGSRFRDLPDEQLQPFANYLNAGKPVIAFRTATHAFKTKQTTGNINWNNFGPLIVGDGWSGHYGKHKVEGARTKPRNKAASNHPILRSVGSIFAESDVYGVKPENVNDDNATILLDGLVTETLLPDSKVLEDKIPQPIAWLRTYKTPDGKPGTCFTTTMGASSDFDDENLRRLLINAAFFQTGLEVPAKADVSYIDPFEPSAFSFIRKKNYFKELNRFPTDYNYGASPQTGPKLEVLFQKRPPKEAPKKKAAAPKTSTLNVKTTLTSIEDQQKNRKRPVYLQPLPAKKNTPTTLPVTPEKGETIVFLGNSLAERMQLHGFFETLLHQNFPDKNITFRNMGKPGHTPAFRPSAASPDPWAFPNAKKFRPEIRKHYGKGHYPKPDDWLTILEADTIVAFFGFNESFDGLDGVANFHAELAAFVDHTLSQSYNHKGTSPRLVLATPIATDPHPDFNLPDTITRNEILSHYADAVRSVAKTKQVALLDLFQPTANWFESQPGQLTINGVHLSQKGYRQLAPLLFKTLFAKSVSLDQSSKLLQQAIHNKTWYWRNDYRMLNGVHAYGNRWSPYGNFNYPEEIEKIRQMTVLRDQNIWAIAQGKSNSVKVDDSKTRPLSQVQTNFNADNFKNGSPEFLSPKDALSKFIIPDGYQVELFASEVEFPNLGNPVQMRFDNKGRLWVATMPSYPHYVPGGPLPADKLMIYEDTNGDGRADKETIFADNLHLPTGFDFASDGGVYLAEAPYLTIHYDTDGDDKSDHREVLLDGFDSLDTHHMISSFDVDHGGGLFIGEGRFLHSQVETPYGPQRMTDGGAWRFDPHSWRVERVLQRDISNPWGIAHDAFGQNVINDASGGRHHWMLGYSVKMPHAAEIPDVSKYNFDHHARPSSGSEFISSRHFPDKDQGDYIYANTIAFRGIKQLKPVEDGPEIKAGWHQNLIESSDGNFRPCDLEIAPDGSLYFIDWHNTLIGHMQHSARDPLRIGKYGRIYRITYPERPLVTPPTVAKASLTQLFENLKLPEMNARKRSQLELRGRDKRQVLAAAKQFAAENHSDPRLLLESLWATWGQNQPDPDLLEQCLTIDDHRIRSAAVRVVRHSLHLLDSPATLLLRAANDAHPRVRLEALSAATWLGGKPAAEILLTVASHPTEKWLNNSLNCAVLFLKDEIEAALSSRDWNLTIDPNLLLSRKLPTTKRKVTPYLTRDADGNMGPTEARRFKNAYRLGFDVYNKPGSCKYCHQDNGMGQGNTWPPLVNSEWVTGETDHDKERLIKIVLHGLYGDIEVAGKTYKTAEGMPPMTALGPMLGDTEIAAVLTYVRNSWGNLASPITVDQVNKVREAYRQRVQFWTPQELLQDPPVPERA